MGSWRRGVSTTAILLSAIPTLRYHFIPLTELVKRWINNAEMRHTAVSMLTSWDSLASNTWLCMAGAPNSPDCSANRTCGRSSWDKEQQALLWQVRLWRGESSLGKTNYYTLKWNLTSAQGVAQTVSFTDWGHCVYIQAAGYSTPAFLRDGDF